MRTPRQKDETPSTKKTDHVRYEYRTQDNYTQDYYNSGELLGQQTPDFNTAMKHAVQLKSQGQLAMQFPIQRKANNTGLPDNLKSGIENLSGYSMDDVKVHYNSPKPAQVQALAYAQGTDIHIGPRQEKHLPHEAWHVVQQKQGRVRPRVQMKGGVGINDDAGLEREADLMGERALRIDRAASQLKVCSLPQDFVVQRRIPTMDRAFITANRRMAIEILTHAVHNLSEEELADLFGRTTYTSIDDVIDTLNTNDVDTIFGVYASVFRSTPESKRYLEESVEPTQGDNTQIRAILGHLDGIKTTLEQLNDNTDLLKGVFGVEDVSVPQGVLANVLEKINYYRDNQICPARILGNRDHNFWIGAGGMTSPGAAQVDLGLSVFQALVRGDSRGKATLIHELTHSTSGTKDNAYDKAGCQKLGPNKRVNNAETYAHAFLQQLGQGQNWQLYDPTIAAGRQRTKKDGSKGSKLGAIRRKRFGEVEGALATIWNNADNTYLAAQRRLLAVQSGKEADAADVLLSNAVLYPHKPSFTADNAPRILALIEDRTKMLNSIKRELRDKIKGYGEEFLNSDDGTAMPMIVEDLKEKFKITSDEALSWAYKMYDPLNYMV